MAETGNASVATLTNSRKRPAGYDLRFAEPPPEDRICPVCRKIAREQHQDNCCGSGKVYCRCCISAGKTCEAPTQAVFPDPKSERQIKLLKVACESESQGCTWTGPLEDVESHNSMCPLIELLCPNKCGEKVYRCDVQDHVRSKCSRRLYTCPACKITGLHKEMTTTHQQLQCPEATLNCPNGCGTVFQRKFHQAHCSVCPKEAIECSYAIVGCQAKPLRQDLRRHDIEGAELHARLAVHQVFLHKLRLCRLQDMLRETHVQVAPVVLKMTDFEAHKASSQVWDSYPFLTHSAGYRLCLSVNANGWTDAQGTQYISMFVYLTKGTHDQFLSWPFQGRLVVQLLNQIQDKGHRSISLDFNRAPEGACRRVTLENRSSIGYGKTKFVSHKELGHNAREKTQFLRNDSVYFRVLFIPQKPWLDIHA